MTKVRSPGSGETGAMPVKLPNAGSTAVRDVEPEAGEALAQRPGPLSTRPGCRWPARVYPSAESAGSCRSTNGGTNAGAFRQLMREVVRRIAGVPVVVAADQQDLELRPERSPAAELRQRPGRDPSGSRVEQIAEHDEAAAHRSGAGRRRAARGRRRWRRRESGCRRRGRWRPCPSGNRPRPA